MVYKCPNSFFHNLPLLMINRWTMQDQEKNITWGPLQQQSPSKYGENLSDNILRLIVYIRYPIIYRFFFASQVVIAVPRNQKKRFEFSSSFTESHCLSEKKTPQKPEIFTIIKSHDKPTICLIETYSSKSLPMLLRDLLVPLSFVTSAPLPIGTT